MPRPTREDWPLQESGMRSVDEAVALDDFYELRKRRGSKVCYGEVSTITATAHDVLTVTHWPRLAADPWFILHALVTPSHAAVRGKPGQVHERGGRIVRPEMEQRCGGIDLNFGHGRDKPLEGRRLLDPNDFAAPGRFLRCNNRSHCGPCLGRHYHRGLRSPRHTVHEIGNLRSQRRGFLAWACRPGVGWTAPAKKNAPAERTSRMASVFAGIAGQGPGAWFTPLC